MAADGDQVCVGGVTVRDFDSPSTFFDQSAGFVRCLAHDGSVRGTGYVETLYQSTGFPPISYVAAILPSPDAIYVVGITEGTLKGSCLDGPCTPGAPRDAFIRKYDSATGGALTTAWTRQVDLGGWDNFQGAAFDSLGNVRVWGTHQRGGDNPGMSIRCYEPDGDECGGSDIELVAESPFAGTFSEDAFYFGTQSFNTFQAVVRRYSLGDGLAVGPVPDWSATIPQSYVYGLAKDEDGVVAVGAVAPGQGLPFGVAVDGTRIYTTGQTTGAMKPGAIVSVGADAFIARIAKPQEAEIRDLIGRVEALLGDGTLKTGQAHALDVKLQQALEAFEDGDTSRLVARLEAFINQVGAFRNAGILSPTQANDLIGIAQSVIDQVS